MKQLFIAVIIVSVGIDVIAYINTQLLGIDLSQFPTWKQCIHDLMPALLGIIATYFLREG